jgi:hypothetical protein
VPISRDGTMGAAQNVSRHVLKKASGVNMPAAFFFDPIFANVSAVVQAHQRDMFNRPLILATVHNPLATNRLPRAMFSSYKEFIAEERGNDEYQLRDIAPNHLEA